MPVITPQQALYYAQLLTSRLVGDRLENLSQSLHSAAVDINPHQVEAALFAFLEDFIDHYWGQKGQQMLLFELDLYVEEQRLLFCVDGFRVHRFADFSA